MEIESRLLPCGLHVVGEPPSAMEAIATLVNIAEIDRPDLEKPIRGLPGILARAIKRNVEEIYQNNNKVTAHCCLYMLTNAYHFRSARAHMVIAAATKVSETAFDIPLLMCMV